jgi:hypothetical protein
MFSSATSTTTEYFSAVSSDDEDDFFDIQTDTEREDEGEDIKQAPVIKPSVKDSKSILTILALISNLQYQTIYIF